MGLTIVMSIEHESSEAILEEDAASRPNGSRIRARLARTSPLVVASAGCRAVRRLLPDEGGCLLRSGICLLTSRICLLTSGICLLTSGICVLTSRICLDTLHIRLVTLRKCLTTSRVRLTSHDIRLISYGIRLTGCRSSQGGKRSWSCNVTRRTVSACARRDFDRDGNA